MRADYLKWDDAIKVLTYLKKENKWEWVSYVSLGLFTGLRISDITRIKWGELNQKLSVVELKTGKKRNIIIGNEALKLLSECREHVFFNDDNDLIVPYTSNYCSTKLKEFCGKCGIWGMNISNHTLRKTFARQVWESNGKSESSLVLLSQILKHSNIAITRIYLGITEQEIEQAYRGLSLKIK